jgi:hypothetical protein
MAPALQFLQTQRGESMTRQRGCVYCRTAFSVTTLIAEPVLPAALGGRISLKRATCPACAARVRQATDDFLATRFALTAGAMAARRAPRAGHAPAPVPSPADWRHASRAAARILYCYLLLELGQSILSSPPAETLRRLVMDGDAGVSPPRWEVTQAAQSPSAGWHVLMFDAVHSVAAIGLFGTIWFRFDLDLAALAPEGRLVTFHAFKGARGMATGRTRTGWRYRSAVRWGWKV